MCFAALQSLRACVAIVVIVRWHSSVWVDIDLCVFVFICRCVFVFCVYVYFVASWFVCEDVCVRTRSHSRMSKSV